MRASSPLIKAFVYKSKIKWQVLQENKIFFLQGQKICSEPFLLRLTQKGKFLRTFLFAFPYSFIKSLNLLFN